MQVTLADDPFRSPPPLEKLVGDLAGTYSRQISIQRRPVYQILPEDRVFKSHYEWEQAEDTGRGERGNASLTHLSIRPRFVLENVTLLARADPSHIRSRSGQAGGHSARAG